jgi:hypothetical protein
MEGMLADGHLRILALFDKPDPMDGPYFEETIYVTPSRLDLRIQRDIHQYVQSACLALGLSTGPIHAELRINDSGCWIIELAARSIGGRCSRALAFPDDSSLEELILKQAMGMPVPISVNSDIQMASGVMMIPIPMPGILRRVAGVDAAKSVAGVTDILIEIRIGEYLTPLPEGDRYLGFIFARASDPETVIGALKLAHDKLDFEIISPDITLESSSDFGSNRLGQVALIADIVKEPLNKS